MNRHTEAVLLLTLAVVAAGCVTKSEMMRPSASTALAKPAEHAGQVVFIRPSGFGPACLPLVIDERGAPLGEAEPKTYFAMSVAPGRYRFHVLYDSGRFTPSTANSVQVEVAAGKTYYVEVGVKAFCVTDLYAVKPANRNAAQLERWLADSKFLELDPSRRGAYTQNGAADIENWLKKADEDWRSKTPEDLAERTLVAADGR